MLASRGVRSRSPAAASSGSVEGRRRSRSGNAAADARAARSTPTPLRGRGRRAGGARGSTPMYVAVDGRLAGLLAVADPVKADLAATAVARLRRWGSRWCMLTGDNRADRRGDRAARRGIDRVVAEVLPEGKVAEVRRLQARGAGGRHGGRRHQRRPGARAGRRRHRHRHRHRRRGRGRRRHADAGRPARRRRRPSRSSRRTHADDAAEPLLGVHLQRDRHPDRGGRALPRLRHPAHARSWPSAAMAFSSVSVVTNSLRLRERARAMA